MLNLFFKPSGSSVCVFGVWWRFLFVGVLRFSLGIKSIVNCNAWSGVSTVTRGSKFRQFTLRSITCLTFWWDNKPQHFFFSDQQTQKCLIVLEFPRTLNVVFKIKCDWLELLLTSSVLEINLHLGTGLKHVPPGSLIHL